MTAPLLPHIAAEIKDITIDPELPLIVCDADEVLLAFMASFETFLHAQDLIFDWSSYRLTGNVKRSTDNMALDQAAVTDVLLQFFAEKTGEIPAVPGASDALATLSGRAQIVVLSNVPPEQSEVRRRALAGHGMDYPLVAGHGPKGPPVKMFAADMRAPVIFLDDSPSHHQSVAEHAEYVLRLHFVHDPRLARLIGPAPACHHRIDDWPGARRLIEAYLDARGF